MKQISLPGYQDSTRALLIEGPHSESYSIFVPCTLRDGRQLSLCVESPDNIGILLRRQPAMLIDSRQEAEIVLISMHVKRIKETSNHNKNSPHMFADENACIDVRTEVVSPQSTRRRGRIAYMRDDRSGSYSLGVRSLYISDTPIKHPLLDAIPKQDLDEAYKEMKMVRKWSRLVDDHLNGKLQIELPGIDVYLKYQHVHDDVMPVMYARYMGTNAGRGHAAFQQEDPSTSKRLTALRVELINFIETLSGLKSLMVNSVQISYDGSLPIVVFKKGKLALHLHVNELPIEGNFLVGDPASDEFHKKFETYVTLAQAVTAISTRMNHA